MRDHVKARHAELQQHVLDPLFEPDGRTRVAQLARCILAAPVPEVPASHEEELENSERREGLEAVRAMLHDLCTRDARD